MEDRNKEVDKKLRKTEREKAKANVCVGLCESKSLKAIMTKVNFASD